MKIIETNLKDLVVIQPQAFEDERGYFMESFKNSFFDNNFPEIDFVQENESQSKKNVLRGLHFQIPPYEQAKLVRVSFGKVLDVAVDLRRSSPTYGEYFSLILSSENKKQMLIPRGFAHGFLVLSEVAVFSYKVDNKYSKEHESGLIWNDSILNIDWGANKDKFLISKKDALLDTFNNFKSPFR